jgi:hypothetical protein
MQDTPTFPTLQTRFNSYTREGILGVGTNQPIQGNEAEVINRVFDEIPVYFADTSFRQKLTTVAKETIEAQISNVCDQLDNITNHRAQNSLPANLQSFARSISTYLEEFRVRFTVPRRLDALEGNSNVIEALRTIDTTKEQATSSLNEIESVLNLSRALVGFKGDTELADYFHTLYDGQTFGAAEQQRTKVEEEKVKEIPRWLPELTKGELGLLGLGAAVLLSVYGQSLWHYLTNNDIAKLIIFGSIAFLAILVFSLLIFIRWFNKKFVGGYHRTSMLWGIGVVISLIAVGIYSYFAVKALKIDANNLNLGEALIKAVVLVAPLYLVRFCTKNFNANRHLAATNLQRAVSIRVFRPFIEELKGETAEAQREVYKAITEIIFKQDETGFISRNEGAGSSSSSVNLPFTS